MTETSAWLDAARPRRRLALAADALTLPYDAAARDARSGVGGEDHGDDARGRDGVEAGVGTGGDEDLEGLLGEAHRVADRLGAVAPERIHPEALGDALTGLRRVRNRFEAVETSWLAQARSREVHREDGASSPSKWAAEQLGGSQRDAADQLRTADRIADLPDTAGAFADGQITRESASAIGRAMQDDRLRAIEDAEQRLLNAARRGGPDQVRKTSRALTATADVESAERDAARKRAQRFAHMWVRKDGMLKVDALLDPDNGEPLYTGYQALFNASLKSDRENQPGEQRSARQRGADVLGEMARRLLAVGELPDTAGRAATVLVTVPGSTLRGTLDEGSARLRFTGPVPPSTARRYACDAGIVPVVLNGRSVPVDIGRASREPTAAQRRCLVVRDGACCRMCGRGDRLLIAHHCNHWADGGPTDLHNLILVCWDCHQLLHEGKWNAAWQPDNHVVFTHPDGRRRIRPPPT